MNISQIYGVTTGQAQPVSEPASGAKATTTAPVVGSAHVAISWLGLVIALVLLRIVYEVSE